MILSVLLLIERPNNSLTPGRRCSFDEPEHADSEELVELQRQPPRRNSRRLLLPPLSKGKRGGPLGVERAFEVLPSGGVCVCVCGVVCSPAGDGR